MAALVNQTQAENTLVKLLGTMRQPKPFKCSSFGSGPAGWIEVSDCGKNDKSTFAKVVKSVMCKLICVKGKVGDSHCMEVLPLTPMNE